MAVQRLITFLISEKHLMCFDILTKKNLNSLVISCFLIVAIIHNFC